MDIQDVVRMGIIALVMVAMILYILFALNKRFMNLMCMRAYGAEYTGIVKDYVIVCTNKKGLTKFL